MSSLVLRSVAKNTNLAERRMKQLVQILYEANHITASGAERAESQFATLTVKAASTLTEDFERFDRKKERLDHFCYRVIGDDGENKELFNDVVRLVLTMSHGNASVESGFSINSDLLVENLCEQSLMAQRTVYDAIDSAGGITSVNISKAMLHSTSVGRIHVTKMLLR